MNFYSRYKDLFQIPDGISIPRSRLRIDDQLFIERPYVPTYKESYNLSSKLKDLRKDYDNLQNTVNQIQQTQKRVYSRGRSGSTHKHKALSNNNHSNFMADSITRNNYQQQGQSPSIRHPPSPLLTQSLPQQSPIRTSKKNVSSLNSNIFQNSFNDKQRDLLKHSEMDYIFDKKIRESKDWDIPDSTIRRVPESMMSIQNGGHQQKDRSSPYVRKHRKGYHNQNPSTGLNGNKQPANSRNSNNMAKTRRDQAKNNIQERREKLSRLLMHG